MRTNGVGRFCDWLNRTVTMAADPEIITARKQARLDRKVRRALIASGRHTRSRLRYAGYDRSEVQVAPYRERAEP